jgi:hypothetical protein
MVLSKKPKKVSLNIKISDEMDARLKRARRVARENGLQFNVSESVERFLEKELKKVEKELSINISIKDEKNQGSLDL